MTRTKARQNNNFQKLVGTGGLHPQRDRELCWFPLQIQVGIEECTTGSSWTTSATWSS